MEKKVEKAYIMLKPDAVKNKVMGKIITMIEEQNGLSIVNAKMIKLNEKLIMEHYAHLTQFDFFPSLSEFMMSGNCLALIVEGENAVAKMRSIMGPTKNAKELAPNSIRGLFSESTTKNVIHGSDSVENAKIEIQRFFGDNQDL